MAADPSTTYFGLFGLPLAFDVDLERLDSNYRELQRSLHPDRYVNATDQERRISMQQATRINEGYQTLKDPLLRGRYLLELGGRSLDEEQRTTSDSEFLMEQMELREALAGVRDAGQPFDVLGTIMERIDTDIVALIGELRQQFADAGGAGLDAAADTLVKMQFFRRLQDEALELEVSLEDELA